MRNASVGQVLGEEPRFTSCHGRIIDTLDYIWFTPLASSAAQPDQAGRQVESEDLAGQMAGQSGGAQHNGGSLAEFEHILGPACSGAHAGGEAVSRVSTAAGGAELWELLPARVVHVPPQSALRCGLPAPGYPSDHISLIADFTSRRIHGQQWSMPWQTVQPGRMHCARTLPAHSQHTRFGED